MSEPESEGTESTEWQPPTEEQIRQRAYELFWNASVNRAARSMTGLKQKPNFS